MNSKFNFSINRLYGYRVDKLFVYIFLVSIFLFFVRLPFDSRVFGEIFQHDDFLDTGMDFFNSVLCVQYGEPYERFKTLYPPLANLFYYFLYSCIPDKISSAWSVSFDNFWTLRSTGMDLRVWQWSLISFILYIQVQTLLSYNIIKHYINKKSTLLPIAIVFSVGMLFATERGNIIVYTMMLVLYFCFNYDSDNIIYKRIALFFLAMAVGLKIYPVVFSVLLLKKRMFKAFFTVIMLSIFLIFIPFIFFGGYESIGIWIDIIGGFGAGVQLPTGTQYMSLVQFFNTSINSVFFPERYSEYASVIMNIVKKINLLLIILVSVYIVYEKLLWKTLLAIGVLIVFGQQSSPVYNTIFLLPGLIMFLNENQDINKSNILYFIFWVLIMIPLPFFGHLITAWAVRCLTIYSMIGIIVISLLKKITKQIRGTL